MKEVMLVLQMTDEVGQMECNEEAEQVTLLLNRLSAVSCHNL